MTDAERDARDQALAEILTFEMLAAGVEEFKRAQVAIADADKTGNVAIGCICARVYLAMRAAEPNGPEASLPAHGLTPGCQ
ncbi:hypothetical protein M446_4108 [Methylobacterium sp. 4-46]|uniref:hypothetical protein n=1 Tax=unclassified Methylobacterium TaxID=2615210 RepID=UPI000152E271|nr:MULTISPECIES: hypothetical protein [Methylobacterium]ACA18466.1 hypothetical protein M446_4108 [Methylobacterium sp. 4-46]WFT77756.1 hypothetical protein QA634_20870 [Methylobacterium nodulans]